MEGTVFVIMAHYRTNEGPDESLYNGKAYRDRATAAEEITRKIETVPVFRNLVKTKYEYHYGDFKIDKGEEVWENKGIHGGPEYMSIRALKLM